MKYTKIFFVFCLLSQVMSAWAEDNSLDEMVLKAEMKVEPSNKHKGQKKQEKLFTPTSNNIDIAKNDSKDSHGLSTDNNKETKPTNTPEVIVKDPRTGFTWSKDRTFGSGAILRTINKITARATEFKTPLHSPLVYGNLEITVRSCWHAPSDEPPENKALIEIWENVPGAESKRLFFGWLLSSSPSISGLEHPIYDVVLTSCF